MNILELLRRNSALVLLAIAVTAMTAAAAAETNPTTFGGVIRTDDGVQGRIALLNTQLQTIRGQQFALVATDLTMWKSYRKLSAQGKAVQAKALLANIRLSQPRYISLELRSAAIESQIDLLNHVVFATNPKPAFAACKESSR